jgi:hypothetical protein
VIKPSNCVPQIRDKKIVKWWDLSVAMAIAAGNGILFQDYDSDYEVVSVKFQTLVTLQSGATALKIGTTGDDDKFVLSTDLAAVAGNRVVGVQQTLTLVGSAPTLKLTAGEVLTAIAAGATNTGEGLLVITLRPLDKSIGNGTKRPV